MCVLSVWIMDKETNVCEKQYENDKVCYDLSELKFHVLNFQREWSVQH